MWYPPDLKAGLEQVDPRELDRGELCCYEGRPRNQPVYRYYGYFGSWTRDFRQSHTEVRGTVRWTPIGHMYSKRTRVGFRRAAWFRVRMPLPPYAYSRIELDKVRLGDLVYLAAVGMGSCVPLIVHDIADYRGGFRDSIGWRTEDADPTHPAFYRSKCCVASFNVPEYYYVPDDLPPQRSRVVTLFESE